MQTIKNIWLNVFQWIIPLEMISFSINFTTLLLIYWFNFIIQAIIPLIAFIYISKPLLAII